MELANRYMEDVDFSDNDEEVQEEEMHVRVRKRYIRDGNNPFEFYNAVEFKRRYRFSKEAVLHGIFPLIEEGLAKINNRGLPIAPVMQLLICLRFYATASFQLILGDTVTTSQSTVSRIVFRVSVLIASLINEYIKLPATDEQTAENRRLFKELGYGPGFIGLPAIDGAIDCTHIRLTGTKFQNINEVYRNRKGYFSLNVQAVVGPRMEILDIVPEWPGSEHDSRIFSNSRIYMRYRQQELTGMLVGDAGYPALPFLLTPVRNPVTENEDRYNAIHGRTRRIVERTFGVLKRRFPCLSRGLTTKLITSTTIVIACSVLHNLSLIYNDILPEEEADTYNEEDDVVPVNEPNWQPGEGFVVRATLIERLFR